MHIDRRTLVKVPEVTAIFWIVKVLTTGMGRPSSPEDTPVDPSPALDRWPRV